MLYRHWLHNYMYHIYPYRSPGVYFVQMQAFYMSPFCILHSCLFTSEYGIPVFIWAQVFIWALHYTVCVVCTVHLLNTIFRLDTLKYYETVDALITHHIYFMLKRSSLLWRLLKSLADKLLYRTENHNQMFYVDFTVNRLKIFNKYFPNTTIPK